MTKAERRGISVLGAIFSLRMFGLFLVLPVLALYAEELAGATPMLVGLALGAYGLTQALLQIPYGLLSDRAGRKPVIIFGLGVFALGSVVAASADSIGWMVAGRALQGAGAIAAVVLAFAADLTREEQRPKAMAFIGVSIGLAFMLALMVGPPLAGWIGVSGLFWVTAGLALVAIVLLRGAPTPAQSRHHDVQATPREIVSILQDSHLFRLNTGVFTLHLVLTAMFVAVPVALTREVGVAANAHWQVYVPVLLLSVIAMLPLLMLAARKPWIPRVFLAGVAILLAGEVGLFLGFQSLTGLVIALWVFFWGFNTLEALLPSLVSRVAPAGKKGAAIGLFNTFQFLGVFLGGTLGGWALGRFGIGAVFAGCAVVLLIWLLVAATAPALPLADTRVIRLGPQATLEAQGLADRLSRLPGVLEATVLADEGVAYLKIDAQTFDENQLRELAG